MYPSACVALLICALSFAAAPVLARGGGGHGAGGHCSGAHAFSSHAGHAGFAHGRGVGFSHHGTACGGCGGYFAPGLSEVFQDYLDRIGPTPASDELAEDDTAADGGERWPDRPSAEEQAAQYRYDHRDGGD